MPTLNWIGKKAVVHHHKEVPFHLLKSNDALSCGERDTGNLLIQGDNLLALKALLPHYAGKVKCIYIDPPYNTGNENWVYNDNVNSPEIKKWLGNVVGKEAEDLSRHDKWLCMMYPRLKLLKELLSEDGAIFISIDDSEQSHLRLICDEIFGSLNFVSNLIWQKKYSPQNDAKYFSDNHDFIICYAKNKNIWHLTPLPRTTKQNKAYKNPDNDSRGAWKSSDLSVKTYSDKYDYPIKTPSGKIVTPPEGRCWAVAKEKFQKLVTDNRIWFGKDGNNVPSLKRFLSEVKDGVTPLTIWMYEDVGHNQTGKQELKKIFYDRKDIFQTPKPSSLIRRILQIATDSNAIILDSFAGSGTTAQAVLEQNKEDNGNRKFILVEMEEHVTSVTAERIKRVINEKNGRAGGFRFCELGETLFDAKGRINERVGFEDLARHVFFTEMREPLPKDYKAESPLVGVSHGTAVYLLYNGILKDKSVNGGNVLHRKLLATLPPHEGAKVIYGMGCRLSEARLQEAGIIFRQIPYQIKVS